MEYKDYYKTLGIQRDASADQIRRAYRDLAKKYHPDRNPGNKAAEDLFKEINEAYEALSDADKRSRYDHLGDSYSQWQQGGAGGNFNWNDWRGGVPGGAGAGVEMGDLFGDSAFSEFFNMIFGGTPGRTPTGTHRTVRGSRPVPDQEAALQITFLEAYAGTTRLLQVNERKLEVKIPAGAHTGTRVRIAGVGPGGRGDVQLVIEVLPDARFERKGNDIYTDVSVDIYTAVLGGSTAVTTPAGKVILTIPAGSQAGRAFRMAGRGMPHLRGQTHGDFYVRLKVQLPQNLTAEEQKLFEQLQQIRKP